MGGKSRAEQSAANEIQLAQRRRMGDRIEAPREVEHFAYFTRPAKAAAAAGELESAGFSTAEAKPAASIMTAS